MDKRKDVVKAARELEEFGPRLCEAIGRSVSDTELIVSLHNSSISRFIEIPNISLGELRAAVEKMRNEQQ